jgi:hypothetical protein
MAKNSTLMDVFEFISEEEKLHAIISANEAIETA